MYWNYNKEQEDTLSAFKTQSMVGEKTLNKQVYK